MEASTIPAPMTARRVPPVLSARALTRDYGLVTAVDGIDLEMAPGDFLTIFGPNGAGKTSLLSLLGGRLKPTSGEVVVGGEKLAFGETSWREPDRRALAPELPVRSPHGSREPASSSAGCSG